MGKASSCPQRRTHVCLCTRSWAAFCDVGKYCFSTLSYGYEAAFGRELKGGVYSRGYVRTSVRLLQWEHGRIPQLPRFQSVSAEKLMVYPGCQLCLILCIYRS
ncbi:hypothetical protein OESDEN_20077 [Oesophagostomum dentatum]|uniref:Uncharacterized protein n=1 Tax=Oesophagostomum dentatum TaxID=61180 RepID=A0A0B1S8N0_OESDE|nr:hypothetical protein OESDEN_20077 [Oesophagostomum dentatum]